MSKYWGQVRIHRTKLRNKSLSNLKHQNHVGLCCQGEWILKSHRVHVVVGSRADWPRAGYVCLRQVSAAAARHCGYTFPVHSRVRTRANVSECVRERERVPARGHTCVAQPVDSSPQCEKYVQTDRAYAYPSAAVETGNCVFFFFLCFFHLSGAGAKVPQPPRENRQ